MIAKVLLLLKPNNRPESGIESWLGLLSDTECFIQSNKCYLLI